MEGFELRGSAEAHRRIYEAIRSRDQERARVRMAEHLEQARWEQEKKTSSSPAESGVVSRSSGSGRSDSLRPQGR
jgi:DNA-binding GntR family transcriptional regulator